MAQVERGYYSVRGSPVMADTVSRVTPFPSRLRTDDDRGGSGFAAAVAGSAR